MNRLLGLVAAISSIRTGNSLRPQSLGSSEARLSMLDSSIAVKLLWSGVGTQRKYPKAVCSECTHNRGTGNSCCLRNNKNSKQTSLELSRAFIGHVFMENVRSNDNTSPECDTGNETSTAASYGHAKARHKGTMQMQNGWRSIK